MKIAIMLALHNNPEQANVFIRQCLTSEECDVFIHIDRKGLNIKDDLITHQRAHVLPYSYMVEWGDVSQIEYVIYMMQYIHEFGHYDYYSIHSGSDLLVRPMSELTEYLKKSRRYAYLDCHPLPWKEWQYGGGLGRLALYWPDCFRKRLKRPSILHAMRAVYGRLYGMGLLKGRKLPDNIQFWGKTAWYTLSGECVDDCLRYLYRHPAYLELFRYSLCGDEIFFNTLVHIVSHGKEIEDHNNLRYVDMKQGERKNVGAPKTLTMDDIRRIKTSGAFLARKADVSVDADLVSYYIRLTIDSSQTHSDVYGKI